MYVQIFTSSAGRTYYAETRRYWFARSPTNTNSMFFKYFSRCIPVMYIGGESLEESTESALQVTSASSGGTVELKVHF